jgi:hypothetical protein
MSTSTIEALIALIGSLLGATMIAAGIYQTIWKGTIHRRALRRTAQEAGVSEHYLEAVLKNNVDLAQGRISADEWRRRAMHIAYRYPVDSGVRELLRKSEGVP